VRANKLLTENAATKQELAKQLLTITEQLTAIEKKLQVPSG
jgi:hypothetical protein